MDRRWKDLLQFIGEMKGMIIHTKAGQLFTIFYLLSQGLLTASTIILLHSLASFLSDPPSFTIIGNTRGGPPTYNHWTKDGVILNSTAEFNISIEAMQQNMEVRYRDSIFESSLTVTGHHPGMYQYVAANPLSSQLMDSILIEGSNNF